jgi:hypothetical protein
MVLERDDARSLASVTKERTSSFTHKPSSHPEYKHEIIMNKPLRLHKVPALVTV